MDLEYRLDRRLAESTAPINTLPPDFKIKRAQFMKMAPRIAEKLGQGDEWRDYLSAPEVQSGGLNWERAWQFFQDGADTGDPQVDAILSRFQNSCEHQWNQGVCLICHKPQ